ncbi:MAG: bifunctional riboflavin kinase/FMN adenylyltransferase [Solirubrobacterales bacterium]|nr:bifunctional riboflavin kinase/FMN adenylyltransferase [Solirubrobacterales bacterium]
MSHAVRVARDPRDLPVVGPRVITIGNFDGVHVGHRSIIDSIVQRGMTSTVVTFDPHPRTYFGGRVCEITSLERRLELLSGTGIDEVLVLPFDDAMAALEPDLWIRRYLEPIDARVVVVGERFRFGRDRAGDAALLRRMGLEVRAVPLVPEVSSTRVRELVGQGDLPRAARLLGRCHEIEVTVVDAEVRRDATTLRLEPAVRTAAMPPIGRYAARVDRRPAVIDRVSDHPDLRARVRAWDGAIGARLRVALSRSLAAGTA